MYKYTAFIIEPRQHKALKFVICNFLCNLSDEWGMIIFHGNNNYEYVKNIVSSLEENQKNRIINIINLNVDDLNSRAYSELFMSKDFYNYIPTNTFLVFQTDSIILKENKDNINLFLDYDYVGAPWIYNNFVGNGGLSIRKKNKMLEIIDSKGYQQNINEDYYFSTNIDKKIVYNVSDHITARSFSVETVFYETPFGVHNFWKYLNKEQNDYLIRRYSEIEKLISLQ